MSAFGGRGFNRSTQHGAADAPTRFVDLDYDRAVDALIAGEIDVAIFPSQLDTGLLRRALAAPCG